MIPGPHERCEVSQGGFKRFSACRRDVVGVCVYCGRAFCDQHGEVGKDGQEICSRKNCTAKKDDLARHVLYKDRVAGRNTGGSCGVTDCAAVADGQCTRCRALFCKSHLGSHPDSGREGSRTVTVMATLCDHCWHRRPIWSRK